MNELRLFGVGDCDCNCKSIINLISVCHWSEVWLEHLKACNNTNTRGKKRRERKREEKSTRRGVYTTGIVQNIARISQSNTSQHRAYFRLNNVCYFFSIWTEYEKPHLTQMCEWKHSKRRWPQQNRHHKINITIEYYSFFFFFASYRLTRLSALVAFEDAESY